MAANNFLTDDIILKDALRLLVNETVMAPLVYRDHERRFGKVGDTISLELPYRTKSAEGPTLEIQPMVDRKTPFKINRHRHVGLEFTQKDRSSVSVISVPVLFRLLTKLTVRFV